MKGLPYKEILQRIKIFWLALSDIFITFCQYISIDNLGYIDTATTYMPD